MLEAALGVFFRSAGRLHDAVQGHEFTDDELAHDVTARLAGKPRKKAVPKEGFAVPEWRLAGGFRIAAPSN